MPIQTSKTSEARVAEKIGGTLRTRPPGIAMPTPPLPPGVGRVIPARTISSLVPSKVRDFIKYAQVLGQHLPHPKTKTVHPLPSKPSSVARIGKAENKPTAVPYSDDVKRRPHRGFLSDSADIRGRGDILYFQFNPEEVRISQQAGWIITPGPGRSHPFIQWGGGEARHVKFSLKFWFTQNEVGNVADNINWIQSFASPQSFDAKTGLVGTPKVLYLYLGKMFGSGNKAVVIPAVLVGFETTFGGPDQLVRASDLLPLGAKIDLDFVVLMRQDVLPIEVADNVRTNFLAEDLAARTATLSNV